MLRIDRIEKKLEQGKKLLGTSATMPDMLVPEILGLSGFDILWIDTEHTSIGTHKELNQMVMSANLTEICVFVRVRYNDPMLVKNVLDMGVDGIVFPNIRTAEEARIAVSSMRYPPEGIRGFGPARATRYGSIDAQKYITEISKRLWTIVQIEDVNAIPHIEEIAAVPGINCMLIGPWDMSGTVGHLAKLDHPDVQAAYEEAARRIKATGIPLGVVCSPEMIPEWLERGADWFVVGGDTAFLSSGSQRMYKESCETIRSILGEWAV